MDNFVMWRGGSFSSFHLETAKAGRQLKKLDPDSVLSILRIGRKSPS
jgi:hypothetical protein